MKPATLSLALLVALAVGGAARAGTTIDATQYMPLGAFNAWEMIDKADWNDGAGVKDQPQLVSVTKTSVVDGVVRYNVRTKLFQGVADALFQFGVDNGTLFLYGVRVIDPGVDLGNSDLSLPTVFFDPPVPAGNATTPLDAQFSSTAITSSIDVSLDLGFKSISGEVDIAGTVAIQWNSQAPILTPLGNLGASGPPLAELQINVDFTYSSPDSDINDAVHDQHTVKGVSGVMAPGLGFVQIDGQGNQQKILNRAILPGELVSNGADPDAFPDPPAGDLATLGFDVPDVVSLDGQTAGLQDAGITDGVLTLTEVTFEHALSGPLIVTAQVASTGAGPVDLVLTGKATVNPATGGLKVALSGKTKKLTDFAHPVVFSVKQELPVPLDGGTPLQLIYKAGKDPVTKLPITGELDVPVTPFIGKAVSLAVNLPVDVPKLKAGLLFINPAKHQLGAEGVLTLSSVADGGSLTFPVLLLESAVVKEGLPTARSYSLYQTDHSSKLFSLKATSTSAADYALTKLSGKLEGVKLAPVLTDVTVTAQ